MKSTVISTLALALLSCSAAAGPVPKADFETTVSDLAVIDAAQVDDDNNKILARSLENSIEKRGATLVVIGITGTAAAIKLVQMAAEVGIQTVKDLGNWNEAREKFTRATVAKMWSSNPDRNKFPAAACYNKGYSVKDYTKVDGRINAKLRLGQLSTDYDCMYIQGPNQFYTHNDGGFVNLAYQYDSARCSHDKATGDLTCR